MTVSRNGQVSIPAATRARWREDDRYLPNKVVVVDMGDYVMVAPQLKDPIRELRGVLAGRGGPSSDEMRGQAREEDAEYEDSKEAQRTAARKGRRSA